MPKINQPFTPEQVEKLKQWQTGEKTFKTKIGEITVDVPPPPFTCNAEDRSKCPNEGILIPTVIGWTCPCGKYKQEWCHDFMVE